MRRIYAKVVADLMHPGHVEFFRQAWALGDSLTVNVVPDARVALAKRAPVLSTEERVALVRACRYVDEVITDGPKVITREFMDAGGFHIYAFGANGDDELRTKLADCADLPPAQLASHLWNSHMMATARDFAGRPAVRLRYAILSTPRSGSTLLARELHRTGLAGDPHEYLNPSAIAAYEAATGRKSISLTEYLHDIESRRTSPNGSFGIKAHYFHVSRLGVTDEAKQRVVGDFLRQQDRRILITRRDKLAQAVSYFIAQRSGRWTSEHEHYLGSQPAAAWDFDPLALGRCLTRIIEDEEGWRRALADTGAACIEVVFEDFLASYRETLKRVASYLGITLSESPIEPALTPTTDPRAAELRERFDRYLSHG